MKNRFLHIVLAVFFSLSSFAQIPCSSGYIGDGVNDFIEIPNTTFININNTAISNRTIEFWFNPSDITTRQVLFEEGGGTNAIVFFIEAGRLYLGQYIDNANPATDRRFFRTASGDLEINKWNHVAMTLNAGATIKWYLNGEEKDSQTGFAVKKHSGDINFGRSGGNLKYPNSLVSNWNASSVGSSSTETYNSTFTGNDNDNYYYNGKISLFRIWNDARSSSEIDDNKSIYLTSGTDLVAYQNGGNIQYKGTSDSGIDSNIIADESDTSFTWNGSSNTTYTNASNWVGSAPDADRAQTVIINSGVNNLTLTSSVKIGSLTVNTGAEVIVQSGATLNVYYNLVNNGTITVENGGSLIYHSCNTAITGSGTYDIQRDTPSDLLAYAYSYISSPLLSSNSSSSSVFPGQILYKYDTGAANPDWAYFSGNMEVGTGYAVRTESAASYQPNFSGTINTNAVEVTLNYFDDGVASEDAGNIWSTEGDNLVGNPYASALDWDKVIADTDNQDIDGTIYYWDQTTVNIGENDVNDYKQYNSTGGASPGVTGKIGTAQAFFVRVTANSTLKLKPTHQIEAENLQFFRGTSKKEKEVEVADKKKNRSWLTLKRGTDFAPILVGFVEGARNKYDRLFDAPFDINQTSLGFYSLIKGELKASIQGLPVLTRDKKVVKLGYVVDQIGEYSINISEEYIDEDYYIYLRDREQKITVDLKQKQTYAFNIDSIGENNERFKLIYTKKRRKASDVASRQTTDVIEIDSEDFSVYVDGSKDLVVEYDFDVDNVKEVTLFNITGKKLKTFKANQYMNVSSLSKGIYIIKAVLSDDRVLTKKIVIKD